MRNVVGNYGIHRDGEHWRCHDDSGEYPGRYIDADAARWGCWISDDEARRINDGEGRLINVDDCRAGIRKALAAAENDAGTEAPAPLSP